MVGGHDDDAISVVIGAHQLGRRKALFADYALPLPAQALSSSLTLAELLGHVVRAEVAAFTERQSERRLLKALSPADLAHGLHAGKVISGGSELNQGVGAETALATALQAFRDGLYLVVVDSQDVRDLATVLTLQANSRMCFVRLTSLVGG